MKKYQLPIEKIIVQLGYENSENLIRYKDINDSDYSIHTMKILDMVRPYAIYFVDGNPFILFCQKDLNQVTFEELSKRIWNAQIPIVFFCDESSVKVYNGTSIDLQSYRLNKVTEIAIEGCSLYTDFSYLEISNPTFWEEYSQKYSSERLNNFLLDNIAFLTRRLKNTYHIKFATKLVLRLIFIRYLIDRGVDLSYGNFSNDIKSSQQELLKVMRKKESLYDLFSHLKLKFNGNLFDLGDEVNSPELTSEVFELLSEFLAGKSTMKDKAKQLSLFALYDFNIIPVELVSSLYEILLGDKVRKRDNAFYTPNYLVEYTLDKTVMPFLKENLKYKILDPSCGSGVFLVDSYRRIVEENLGNIKYCEDDEILKNLLVENIFGIDINEEAIDVTIFSLYLTVLDYKNPKGLSNFNLPNLKGINLFVSDFFDDEKLNKLKNIQFDFIIGNPPWGSVRKGLHVKYYQEKGHKDKQQNNEISRSFILRSKDFSSSNTICCFILPSKLLYTQKNPSKNFRRFLLEKTKIYNIVEMSSVRKLVFENADAPAAIISFRYCEEENLNNRITYISIKPNIFFRLFNIIVVEKNDVKYVSQRMLHQFDWAWKAIVYGFSGDIETLCSLEQQYRTIEQTLEDSTPKFIYGAGIQDHLGDAQDSTHLKDLLLLDSDKGLDHFSIYLDSGKKFDKDKIHRARNRKLFEPPYCITAKGVDCSNYKMRSAYSDESFVCKETMYIIKGSQEQKNILLNLTGLLNSSFYSYLNLMLGSSIGIEREQRFMDGNVLNFPYCYHEDIVRIVERIHDIKKDALYLSSNLNDEIIKLDYIVLKAFGLENNNFIDYAINIQIPELTNLKNVNSYRKVSYKDLMAYSKCFEKQFSLIFERIGKYISITLYPDVLNRFSIFELSISDKQSDPKLKISNIVDTNRELLTKFCVFKYNDKFHQMKDVIYFDENSFFIIKPNNYKYWHPAIAELDLADVIDQIMSNSGGER